MAQRQPKKMTKQYGGYKTVIYRDAAGQSYLARVTSAGTGSTVNLYILDKDRRTKGNQSFSNVPLATSMKSTNAYFNITS